MEPFSLLWPSVKEDWGFAVYEDCSRRFDELVAEGVEIVLVLETAKGIFDAQAALASYLGEPAGYEHDWGGGEG
jgi:hypothetical protein